MSESNGSPLWVYFREVDAQVPDGPETLAREGLVDLEDVDVRDREACFLERWRDRCFERKKNNNVSPDFAT